MGAQQIVPAITVNEVGGLAVDGDILLHVAFHALSRLRVKFDEADAAPIGTVGRPQTTCRRVEQQRGVNGVTVFHAVTACHLDGFGVLEIR